MGNVQAIPADKLDRVSAEEREEFEAYRNGEDNLYEAGIRVGDEGFYDPTAGSKYEKTQRPVPSSNDQPRESTAKVISRERNFAVESGVDSKSTRVVDSKGSKASGRKANSGE